MPVLKLNGPLGGDYVTDGRGNAIVAFTDPVTDDNDLGGRVTAAEAGLDASRRVLANTLAATLAAGQSSLAIQVLGDSTGVGNGKWPDLLAQAIAAAYPAYEVRRYDWDEVNLRMPTKPTVVQAPPSSARRCTWTGSGMWTRRADGSAITGDIDIRVRVSIPNWATGGNMMLAARYIGSPNNGWRFHVGAGGTLRFDWSEGGTTLESVADFGVWSPPTDTPIWVRVTLDVDNGSGGHVLTAYQSTDGASWTQVGSTITRAGKTTNIASTGTFFEIGGRGNSLEMLTGSILEVQIRDGIDGPLAAPALPEHWYGVSTDIPSPAGSPIMSIVNGSHSGAGLTTLTTNLLLMSPNYGQVVAIISDGHNQINDIGPMLYSKFDAYCTAVRDRLPAVPLLAVTQNPRIDPANVQAAQAQRRTNYLSWEAALGWTVIDTYGAFVADGRGLPALINGGDGIHPNADGQRLWADVVIAALGLA